LDISAAMLNAVKNINPDVPFLDYHINPESEMIFQLWVEE